MISSSGTVLASEIVQSLETLERLRRLGSERFFLHGAQLSVRVRTVNFDRLVEADHLARQAVVRFFLIKRAITNILARGFVVSAILGESRAFKI
jgi:hypothetical protein